MVRFLVRQRVILTIEPEGDNIILIDRFFRIDFATISQKVFQMNAGVRDSTKESHNIVVAGLRECESRKSVDSLFEHYGIDAIGLRITLLNCDSSSP